MNKETALESAYGLTSDVASVTGVLNRSEDCANRAGDEMSKRHHSGLDVFDSVDTREFTATRMQYYTESPNHIRGCTDESCTWPPYDDEGRCKWHHDLNWYQSQRIAS